MRDNVLIKIYEQGKLKGTRSGHNICVDNGREWLAHMIGYSTISPDVPERNERIRYFGVGIGGKKQGLLPIANSPPLSTSYPVGYDPTASGGNDYNVEYPVVPYITTLERPVRITGGSTPYPGAVSDTWLVDSPNIFFTHTSPYELAIHAIVDATAGDVVYAPFTQMPLSEAALLLDEASVDVHTPYSPVVAYYSFDTILLTSTMKLEFIWTVRF